MNELPTAEVPLPKRNRPLIEKADVICYPPGSLYSSVIANLLPTGVGTAIAKRDVPKVYLPSLGTDPEALGHDLAQQVAAIIAPLQADAGHDIPANQFLTHVLCDKSMAQSECDNVTNRTGIACHRLSLRLPAGMKYDPSIVAQILASLD
jgi:hypothetical protein